MSRHELFPLRAPLLSMESCISDFLDDCDADEDHKITLVEWGKCLGASPGKFKPKSIDVNLVARYSHIKSNQSNFYFVFDDSHQR